mmetsp:Transcript_27337/g.58514  ORF Transcript_27337/g.58514 Transcript_27337/m.58514 type:complete len:373 (-) Transcript_27337:50-1168(-)
MMLHQFISVFLVASVDVQCHAFKEVKRRSALAIGNPCHHHGRKCFYSARSLISIRGGSDDYDEDEYDDTTSSFIASFESELADIRREAEMEAENEMQMLRGLIERKGVKEDEKEKEPEYHKNIDGSNENEKLETALNVKNGELTDDVLIQEETLEKIPDEGTTEAIEKSEIGSDKALHDDGIVEAIEKSEVESDVGDGINEETVSAEDDKDLQHDKSDLPVDPNGISDNSAESDSEIMGAGAASVISTDDPTIDNGESIEGEVNQEIKPKKSKPKTSKKKRKMSKKGKNKKKKRIILSEDGELSDGGQEVDLGASVMLTRAQDELTQLPQSGIMFYLRSDLGRALCLFVATISVAVLTTRMQRQMEAEGIKI